MKKVLLLSVMAIMTLALNAQQLAFAKCQVPAIQKAVAEENTMQFSYCGDFATMLGFGTAGTVRAVIEVPAETASKYNGTQVTNVKVGIGSFGLNPGAQIVFLRDLEGSEPIYSQEFKPTQKSWNEVALETPFTITNEKFYVGYQIKVTSNQHYPLSIDNTAANALGDIVGLLDTKTNAYQYVHLGEQGFNNNCIVLTLTGDNLPQYDLTLDKLSVKEYIKTGDAFSISGSIKNVASKTINTFDLTYQIGNAEAQTQAITVDGGLANSQYYNFQIDNLIINEDGVNDITVTVSNPNGQADEYDADNTITKQTTASSKIVPRKILLEHFSTAQCPNCPPVHDMLHELLEGRNDVAWVVHHTGFYEDDFTIQPSRDYMWFYGNTGTFAPAAMLDRRCLGELGAEGATGEAKTPIFFPGNQNAVNEYIEYCLNFPSFISLQISGGYFADTKTLYVQVSGERTTELASKPCLNIFLTEDGLKGSQKGASGTYTFNNTMRKVMTSTWGDEITWNDNKFTATYSCTLDASWKPENMKVVAFVADYTSSNYNACTIHNTETADVTGLTAVNKVTNNLHNVATWGKTITLEGQYSNATVYSIDGRLVKQANGESQITMDNAGIYIVVVDGESHKVVIR